MSLAARRVKRSATVAAIAVLGVAAVPAERAVANRNPKAPSLASMLLTVGELPTGWGVDNSTGSGVGCLHAILEPPGVTQTANASVTFADNASLPQVSEKLATYKAPIRNVFATVVGNLDRCRTVKGTSEGNKVTGTVGQMSFPQYGDQSAAFTVSLTVNGVTADEDALIVRKGAIMVGVTEGTLGPPDIVQFQGFVRKALARVG